MKKFESYSRVLPWFMALLLSVLVAACGGGGDQGRDPILGLSSLASLAVTPATASIPMGGTQQFTATATYNDGSSRDVTASSSWTSGTTSVATVNSTSGLATGVISGTSVITATFGGKSATGTLTVTAATLTSITVTPATASIPISGIKQFTATATYSDASTSDVTASSSWTSGTTSVATVNNTSGLATGVTSGSSVITATYGGKSATGTLTVTNVALTSIAVTPATASIPMAGTQQFTATATYSDASTVNVTAASSWSSGTTSVATVNSTSGLATGVVGGSSVITATFGGKNAAGTLNVTNVTLTSIAVTPATASIAMAGNQQYTATATYSDASTSDVTASSSWSSGTTSVATVNSTSGLATGVAAGSSIITATYSGKTATATLTVTNVTVSSFVLSPATASIQPTGTQQFTAFATYSDGTTGFVTASTAWTSSDTSVATILTTGGATPGLATGVKIGTSTITATVGGLPAQTAILNVTLNLKRAARFAVLAGAITNNAATTVINTGDVGGSSITAAPTISSGAFYTTGAPTYDDAMTDLPSVIADANNASLYPCGTSTTGGMGTVTMTPGIHCIATDAAISGVVTLTLNGPGVYIFRTAGALATSAGSTVGFSGGADNTNTSVFWVVGSSDVGSPGTFVGTILSAGALKLGDGDTLLNGRVLTTAAATLTNNKITKPTP